MLAGLIMNLRMIFPSYRAKLRLEKIRNSVKELDITVFDYNSDTRLSNGTKKELKSKVEELKDDFNYYKNYCDKKNLELPDDIKDIPEKIKNYTLALTCCSYREYIDRKTCRDLLKKAKNQYKKLRGMETQETEYNLLGYLFEKFSKPDLKEIEKTVQGIYKSRQIIDEYISFVDEKGFECEVDRNQYKDLCKDLIIGIQSNNDIEREFNSAKYYYDEAYISLDKKGNLLLEDKKRSVELIESIESFVNSIAKTPKSYNKDMAEISFNRQSFNDLLVVAEQEKKKAIKNGAIIGAATIGAGAIAAYVAPNAITWVTATFGTTASTTAIASLSGVGAASAGTATIGGATVAGAAGGKAALALLGPIGIGLAVTGIGFSLAYFLRKKKLINEKIKTETMSINEKTEKLQETELAISLMREKIINIYTELRRQFFELDELGIYDYDEYSLEQKEKLGSLVNNTKTIAVLINGTLDK